MGLNQLYAECIYNIFGCIGSLIPVITYNFMDRGICLASENVLAIVKLLCSL